MSPEEQHLEELMAHLAREISETINEVWKKLPRTAPAPVRAQMLDQCSIRFEALAAGFSLLAERTRTTAESLLDQAQH
jgi:hypothetical protein